MKNEELEKGTIMNKLIVTEAIPNHVDNYVWLKNEYDYVDVWYRIGNLWNHQEFRSAANDPIDARTRAHRFSNNFDSQHYASYAKELKYPSNNGGAQ